ncbi:hypothetical protein ACJZ2D_010071 [Fusarium nematophilum]
MANLMPNNQPPLQVPLCQRHFKKFARAQIKLHTEEKRTKLWEAQKSQGQTSMQPTRVQPRRAVKDRYQRVQAKVAAIKAAKRQAEDELLPEPAAKRLRVSDPAEDLAAWTTFESSLKRGITRTRNTNCGECSFGPGPWVCSFCTDQVDGSAEDAGSEEVSAIAPVADMAPIGEQLELYPTWDLDELEVTKRQCGNLSYVIDACNKPMFMFL